LWLLRRPIAFLAPLAALLFALPAAGGLEPVRRAATEAGPTPTVRAGTLYVPPGHDRGLTRVVVRLAGQPLAAWGGRSLQSATRTKLNTRSASSKAYLARLAAAQRTAAARIERAIPEATVLQRYRVVLNGFAIELPTRQLPRLLKLGLAAQVYPNVRYTLATNRSPDLIRAAAFSSLRGLRGDGIKIGIVDDGVDNRSPFLQGAGYTYPAGFPRGGSEWTNGKIIVARAFPGPNSGRQGRQAFVPNISFHGTHVAGIAAGNAGTVAPSGSDHPTTPGLSGVAPRAWIGNYRVFNAPTPIGYVANAAEIIEAFEAAVQDGMDVINFSGGGAMSEPAADPILEAVGNVARAGVVPVISAGNDRDDFGFGTVGSPGVAEEAISVAAVSNTHVFAPPLRVVAADAPESLRTIPMAAAFDAPATDQQRTLVDVTTIMGRNGRPVDPLLCGSGIDPNDPASTQLPAGSLDGMVALASRGVCTFLSKAQRARAAGAVGLILADNRFGEANAIPLQLPVPAAMIADLDGQLLRGYLAQKGGRTIISAGRGPVEIVTGRSGIVTSFSSAAPTNFGHTLKPDVAAPGGQILSSTSPESAGNGSPFAVFDGTSMSAPHVAGAAALLLQAHPTWTPRQMRSSFVSTAGPAWGNTARTQEAPVLLQGGGLVDVVRADQPLLFTSPVSLSFGDVNVNRGPQTRALATQLEDAGGGAGTWSVELRPQAASAGATVEPDPQVTIAPGGGDRLGVTVRARADAAAGDNFGFIVLRRGDVTRRIPYYFAVTRPGLELRPPAAPLREFNTGDTRDGASHANAYRFPSWPFGPPAEYPTGPGMVQDGAEDLYTALLDEPVVNFGAAVWLTGAGAVIDPWILGSPDENDVQGQGGTPINVNNFTFGYRLDVGAAAVTFPRPKRYWISVDSGRDRFTGLPLHGAYVLKAWQNDVYPPLVGIVSARVTAGRPLVIARVLDYPGSGRDSGIDPTSLVLSYRRALVGASAYDPVTGYAIFGLPAEAPRIPIGPTSAQILAADFQEAKNVSTPGGSILPNTTVASVRLRGVAGPTVTWLDPERTQCVDRRRQRLLVAADSDKRLRTLTFFDGKKRIASVPGTTAQLYASAWPTGRAKRGRHTLTVVARDAAGREARATRLVRVCR
jgi:minor extracellular serine protease Vpr